MWMQWKMRDVLRFTLRLFLKMPELRLMVLLLVIMRAVRVLIVTVRMYIPTVGSKLPRTLDTAAIDIVRGTLGSERHWRRRSCTRDDVHCGGRGGERRRTSRSKARRPKVGRTKPT